MYHYCCTCPIQLVGEMDTAPEISEYAGHDYTTNDTNQHRCMIGDDQDCQYDHRLV